MRKLLVMLVVLLVPLVAGCATLEALKKGGQSAVVVIDEAKAVSDTINAEIAKLPPGDPARVALEKKAKRVQDIIAKADGVVDGVAEALANDGQLNPGVQAALSALPYGSYIGLGLSVGGALLANAKRRKTMSALRSVVQSWQEVGEDLTPDEKREVATIQGPDTTALVHQIKTELVQK